MSIDQSSHQSTGIGHIGHNIQTNGRLLPNHAIRRLNKEELELQRDVEADKRRMFEATLEYRVVMSAIEEAGKEHRFDGIMQEPDDDQGVARVELRKLKIATAALEERFALPESYARERAMEVLALGS